ncbi:hypothetical protein C8F01DRAFT_1360507 [Mycena amicta]|nr:hypothetical protein C8F01DRAFT_1360507 [Mycena amicta]
MSSRLAIAETRLARVEDEIAKLQIEQIELHDQEFIRASTPLSKLPNEMIVEILTHYLPAYPNCAPQKGPGSPIHLMLVCRQWRDIVVGTPTFWRALHFEEDWPFFEPQQPSAVEEEAERVHTWLSRSRNCLLSPSPLIVIDWSMSKSGRSGKVTSILSWAIPHLRELAIRLHEEGIDGRMLFDNAPALRKVVIAGSDVLGLEDSEENLLPWHQISSLTLASNWLSEVTRVLNRIPLGGLVHCRIMGSSVTPGEETMKAFPQLRTLVLESSGLPAYVGESQGYLDTFTTPALQRLEIPECFLWEDPVDTLERFIARSECKLQELRITGSLVFANEEQYRQAFPFIPALIFDHTPRSAWNVWDTGLSLLHHTLNGRN